MTHFSRQAQLRIIPSLLCRSAKECRVKAALLNKQHVIKKVHIDVMDGHLVTTTNWGGPTQLAALVKGKALHVHLMVAHPLRRIAAWKHVGAQRIYFHIESADDPRAVIKAIHARGLSAGIALNPSTPLESVRWLIPFIDAILVVSNSPGASGRVLLPSVYARLRALRKMARGKDLCVDIGVTPATADALIKNGATHLISGSAFYRETRDIIL